MHKQSVVCLIYLFAKNSFYILIFLLNCDYGVQRLVANAVHHKTSQKCSSFASTADSEWSLISRHLSREFLFNHSLHLFGFQRSELMSKRRRHNIPPQYMLDLYSMVANTPNDINAMKYNSKTVRSVTHSDLADTSSELNFYFNFSQLIPSDEHIIEAEFHIYKLKSHTKPIERRDDPKHNLLEVKVYQILSTDNTNKRLLDVRRMSTHSVGWDVFYVKQAVLDWISDPDTNYGLQISVKTLLDENVKNEIRFANRYRNHMNKQPMIVVFTSDHKQNSSSNKLKEFNSKYDYGFSALNGENSDAIELNEDLNPSPDPSLTATNESFIVSDSVPSNGGTSSPSSYTPNSVCSGRQLSIDFESIGWSSCIISPKGFTTYLCEGKCVNRADPKSSTLSDSSFGSASRLRPYYWTQKGKRSRHADCCFANKFNAMNALFFDDRGNVVLKRFDRLLVQSCGCHSSLQHP